MRDTLDLKQLEQQAENDKQSGDLPILKTVTNITFWFVMVVVVLGFITMFNSSFITSLFNAIPENLSPLIYAPFLLVFAVFIVVTLINMLRPKTDYAKARMETELRRMPPLEDLPKSRTSTALTVFFFIVGLGWFFVADKFNLPFLSILFLAIPFFVALVVIEIVLKNWLNAGKFEAVINLTGFIQRFISIEGQTYAGMLAARAFALMASGKVDDSIPYFLHHLNLMRRTRNPHQVSGSLNNLGYALVMAERYDEALPLLESSLSIKPDLSNAYDSLACLYLEQGIFPERALEIAQAALEYTPKTKSTSRGVQLATGARAYALTKNVNYTKLLVNEALAMAGTGHMDAEIYRQVGHAAQALGKIEAARKYYQQAIKLNPQGLYGQKARRALLATKTMA